MDITVATPLPALIDRARNTLALARTSAEILDAKDQASIIYDLAKKASRLAKAKDAHDTLIATAYRVQGDALEIEAGAKHRLADEYGAGQERGEVATRADQNLLPNEKKVSVDDIGITHKDVYEARLIRDAEIADPGIVRRTVQAALAAGEEPAKAKVKRAAAKAVNIAELKGEGHSNREIAKLIGVDEKTVRNDDAEFSAPIQEISHKINGADGAHAEFSAPAEPEDDDDIDGDMSPKEIAHRAKMAFLLRANEAKNFAFFPTDQKADREIIKEAESTRDAWDSLVTKIRGVKS